MLEHETELHPLDPAKVGHRDEEPYQFEFDF